LTRREGVGGAEEAADVIGGLVGGSGDDVEHGDVYGIFEVVIIDRAYVDVAQQLECHHWRMDAVEV
jgi:hypothetical protein